jgi:hypothetical protein
MKTDRTSQATRSLVLTKGERLAVGIFAWTILFLAGIGLLLGLSHIPNLIGSFQEWEMGEVPRAQLARTLLHVTPLVLISAGIMEAVAIRLRRFRRVAKGLKIHPKQPWLAEPAWATDVIRSSSRGFVAGMLWRLLFWGLVLVPLAVAFDPTFIKVIVALVGLALLGATWTRWRNRRWHTAELRLITLPGVLWGPFTGVFTIRKEFPENSIFDIDLRCTHFHSEQSDSSDSNTDHAKRKTIWGETRQVARTLTGGPPGSTSLTVHFAIPLECPESSVLGSTSQGYDGVQWQLKIQQHEQLGQATSTFVIPVFRTKESSKFYQHDEELVKEFEPPVDANAVLKRGGYHESNLTGGSHGFGFHHRNHSGLWAVTSMALVLLAGIYLMVVFIKSWPLSVLIGIVPALMLFGAIYFLIDLFTWRCWIVAGKSELEVESGIVGLRRH